MNTAPKMLGLMMTGRKFNILTITKCSLAFTLSEVLITLGIVGVAAALTIPNLIANYEKQITVSKLKKGYSVLSEAFNLSKMELGSAIPPPSEDWEVDASNEWWSNFLIPYIKPLKTCSGNSAKCMASATNLDSSSHSYYSGYYYFILPDEYSLALLGVGSGTAYIFLDINGFKKPNQIGKDVFFLIYYYNKSKLTFYGAGEAKSDLTKDVIHSCNKSPGTGKGYKCGALIQLDGWQISNDYPW